MAVAYVTATHETRTAYRDVGQEIPSANYLAAITQSAMQPLRAFVAASIRESHALQLLDQAVEHLQDNNRQEEDTDEKE